MSLHQVFTWLNCMGPHMAWDLVHFSSLSFVVFLDGCFTKSAVSHAMWTLWLQCHTCRQLAMHLELLVFQCTTRCREQTVFLHYNIICHSSRCRCLKMHSTTWCHVHWRQEMTTLLIWASTEIQMHSLTDWGICLVQVESLSKRQMRMVKNALNLANIYGHWQNSFIVFCIILYFIPFISLLYRHDVCIVRE